MKWPLPFILSVAVLLSSCAATPLPSPPPTKLAVIEQALKSIVRLTHPLEEEGQTAVCTGFAVGSDLIVTATHCLGKDLTINDLPTEVVRFTDTLTLLKVKGLKVQPIKVRKTPLRGGEEVVGLGYGYGFLNVFTRDVAVPRYEGTEVLLDGLMVPGMSGGPVVDVNGEVIGIVQAGRMGIYTILCGQDELREFIQ